jgi:hypothetical protein
MTIENKLVPQGAMQLVDKGCHATTEFMKNEDGSESPKMQMVVYSGSVIKDHWYWDDLLIDLEGMKAGKKKYPVLEDHSTYRKIAFSGKPVVKDGMLQLNPEDTIFVDTPESNEFQKLSKQGFPFQSSVRVNPRRVERIAEGSEAMANGQVLKGPATIFREWEYVEGSVCVFGWDNQTSSAAFTKDEVQLSYELTLSKIDTKPPQKEDPKIMNLDQFKKDYPELLAEIIKTATDQANTSFVNEKTVLTGTIEALTVKLTESDSKIKELAKKDAIRAEREMFAEADSIWNQKLKDSKIPERMFNKVKKNVDHNAFVKDDVLDKTAFGAAVDAELKDWEDFKVDEDPKIQGTGFSQKDVEKKTATEAENNTLADKLFAMVSPKPAK